MNDLNSELNALEKNNKALIQNERSEKSEKNSSPTYPKRITFIIGMEFCERFSYYGMRTILVLYARNYLMFDDDSSTAIYHAFTLFAYLTPLFGGILADSYLGKYKAIAYLSVVYVLGHVLKTIAAIPYISSAAVHIALSMFGLFLIAVGTGGIKPCVSSFGGDQFTAQQTKQTRQYFSLFYFSINLGALISKWLTPMFRADLNCYPGHDEPQFQECFSVAFGIPGLLMLVALGLFLMGSPFYTRVPAEGSVFWKFCECIFSACKNRWIKRNKVKRKTKQHWIDYSNSPKKMKQDTMAVLRVLFLFLPLPFFWALFDQQGSRWTLQALKLNGYWGNYLVKPDQIDVINPLLIVLLIPTFEVTLYPLLSYCKINFTPLRRMTAGLILAGFSFVCAAVLQFQIDKQMTPLPTLDQFSVRIINVSPCTINLTSSASLFNGTQLKSNSVSNTASNFLQIDRISNVTFTYHSCNGSMLTFNVTCHQGQVNDVIVGENLKINPTVLKMPSKKLENGSAMVTFLNLNYPENISVRTNEFEEVAFEGERSRTKAVQRGKTDYSIYLNKNEEKLIYNGTIQTETGGVYTVILIQNSTNSNNIVAVKFNNDFDELLDLNPNSINIAWMIPQYFIITVGEIFLSVTGLEFSYTQAPANMKSVLSSFWLLTVSIGNVIVLTIAETRVVSKQANEFLLFSGLIGIAAIVFAWMTKRYKPMAENDFRDVDDEPERMEVEEQDPLVTEV